jgi:hypothetical protein
MRQQWGEHRSEATVEPDQIEQHLHACRKVVKHPVTEREGKQKKA